MFYSVIFHLNFPAMMGLTGRNATLPTDTRICPMAQFYHYVRQLFIPRSQDLTYPTSIHNYP